METVAYNDAVLEYKNAADTLGSLQRKVDSNGFKEGDHSYYMGMELNKLGVVKAPNTEYRKMDAVGSGSGGHNGRSKNRVVVVRNKLTGKLVEGEAYFWRHDDRLFKMGSGFFERAKMYRNMKF